MRDSRASPKTNHVFDDWTENRKNREKRRSASKEKRLQGKKKLSSNLGRCDRISIMVQACVSNVSI